MAKKHVILILGGARSGKSTRAQTLAETYSGELIYLATAEAFDDEMIHRIATHRGDRGSRWRTIECPIELPASIRQHTGPERVILVDCLTLWASNIMLRDLNAAAASIELVAALKDAEGPIILVSNEVGMGIVPDNAMARQFRDIAGRLNQTIAATADSVELVVAGLSLALKGPSKSS